VRSLIIFAIKYFHADPNEKRKKDNSEQSENPLQLAIKIQNREVVKALIQNRAIENLNHSEMKYTLTETVKNLDYILLEYLLQNLINPLADLSLTLEQIKCLVHAQYN
jgi:hypothetical protein